MGVFEHFPYVNFHELNLSWIINKLKELEDVIGSQIVDIVARAGVAANAQAIQDLDTELSGVESDLTTLGNTVTANATTAHNESQAALNAANAAQATADANTTAIEGKQSNLGMELTYTGTVQHGSYYLLDATGAHQYLIVWGSWNFRGIYFANPQNGGSPQVATIQSTVSCSIEANGSWGLKINNLNSSYDLPVTIFKIV